MRVPILSARRGWHTDDLCRALDERGHRGVVVPYEGLVARLGTARPSAAPGTTAALASLDELLDTPLVLARIVPGGSLEQVVFRVDALHWLASRGVRVVNSARAIERTVDKFFTTALLEEAGLPSPRTVVCQGIDEALAVVREWGDVVVKPLFGSMGHGLVRLTDPDTGFRVLKALAAVDAVFYVQQWVEHGGRDVRAFVVGGRVVGAIARQAADGDWRANVSRGASAAPVDLPEAWRAIAERAARAVEADYAGVDLLPCDDGVFVNEVNGIPGWQGLRTATGLDVAGLIVEHALAAAARAPRGGERTA